MCARSAGSASEAILRAVRDRVILDFGVGTARSLLRPLRAPHPDWAGRGPQTEPTNSEADGVLRDPSLSI
eukprot:3567991-Prymnesium_polylepis.1